MHLVIPSAAPPGPQCQQKISQLRLPKLAALLRALSPTARVQGDPENLSPLPERVLALSMGLPDTDGLIPWAALDATRLGLTRQSGPRGWAWITPCHWKVQSDRVEMDDPGQLALTGDESAALRRAMQGYFQEDGITLHPLSAGTWLAQGAVFESLPTASLERVRGASVDTWMPRQVQAKPLRRLQNEMQMLLYTHPVNDTRAAHGLTPVSSFWVSGTGEITATLPQGMAPATQTCTVLDTLQAPAQRDDAAAWVEGWQELDAIHLGPLVERATQGQPVQLTLCGEHLAQTYARQTTSLWGRLQRRWTAPPPQHALSPL